MSNREFEDIADNICSVIISDRKRKIARNELVDHLICEMDDVISHGASEEEALHIVLENFGEEEDVKERTTKSYRNDNIASIINGALGFVGYTAIAGVLFIFQMFFAFLGFDTDIYICHCCLLFIILTILSYVSVRTKNTKLPLFIIPNALLQLINVFSGVPTFILAVPELIKGDYVGFLKDIRYYELVSTKLSQVLMAIFILIFVLINALISLNSFKLKSKRIRKTNTNNILRKLSAVVMGFVVISSALCFGCVFISNGLSAFNYVQEYYIVPADSKDEIDDILSFYDKEAENDGEGIMPGTNDIYQTDGLVYKIWYHHDLNSAVIDAEVYEKGVKKIPKWTDWDWMHENGYYPENPDFTPIYDLTYEDTPEVYGDKTLTKIESDEKTKRDAFYTVWASRVEIRPEKKEGYLVAIPFVDKRFRTDKAIIIDLPLENDHIIHGNMHLNAYEIVIKKAES